MSEYVKGKLRITNMKHLVIEFTSDDGTIRQEFKTTVDGAKKYFCSSTKEQALAGVPARWDMNRELITEEWDVKRKAQFTEGNF